jgi:hypothetical protein
MRHVSIKLNTPQEFINVTPINPLISKCQIKVCYVGDTPNRNGSVITKETATEMANSLPGSPIVGRYLKEKEDFEEHSREMVIEDGELTFKDLTQPYGFVDLNAKCWFQKFMDDGVEHEYLMTEGYIWTGRYPEAQRIIDKGNNQSMELDDKSLQGSWSKDENGFYEFFIINEAVISALCILGEDVEPCFEGAAVTKVQFSLENGFKEQLFSMINEMKEILSKGGEPVEDNKLNETSVVEEITETPEVTEEFAAEQVEDVAEPVVETPEEVPAEEVEAPAEESAEEEETIIEDAPAEETAEEEVVEKDDTIKFSVEEFTALQAENETLKAEIEELKAFKLNIERVEKQNMIDKFYMLSDEDKADVVANIDTYTLDEIESKLCVTCFRKNISFSVETKEEEAEDVTTYNLQKDYDSTPAWIKAIEMHSKK